MGFAQRADWVHIDSGDGAFSLVSSDNQSATLIFEDSEHGVIEIAVTDLAKDIERVSGQRPDTQNSPEGIDGPVVLVGTIGKSVWIDALVEAEKIDLSSVEGQRENFLLQSVDQPLPGVEQGFVIIGSDPRGTAFGVYELSQKLQTHSTSLAIPRSRARRQLNTGVSSSTMRIGNCTLGRCGPLTPSWATSALKPTRRYSN